jgi:Ca2+-binding RTX toxin-like protein
MRWCSFLGSGLASTLLLAWPVLARAGGDTCMGLPATISGTGDIDGTPGDDVIVGSPDEDRIDGGGGNDRICALEGNDQISVSGGGADAGPGDDRIRAVGTLGNELFGGPGNDPITAKSLPGGLGEDTCKAKPGVPDCEIVRGLPPT